MQRQETFYGQILGQVIRGRREMQGMNLLSMANSMELASASGWSRVETGDTAMTIAQLRRAARKLGTQPAEIVRQADVLAAQLEANGVKVHDEKPKNIGKWLMGAGILALLAGGAAAAAAAKGSQAASADDDGEDDRDGNTDKVKS